MKLWKMVGATIVLGAATLCGAPQGTAWADDLGVMAATGATLSDSTSGLGAVVSSVTPGGGFDAATIQVGDIILAVDGQSVAGAADAYSDLSASGTHTLRVQDGATGQVVDVYVST